MDELDKEVEALISFIRKMVNGLGDLVTFAASLKDLIRDGRLTEREALEVAKALRKCVPPEFPSIDLLQGAFLPPQEREMN